MVYKKVVIICFPLIATFWVLRRIMDLVCGRFLLLPFGVSFVLLTSLPLDDREVWLAFDWLWFFLVRSVGLRL